MPFVSAAAYFSTSKGKTRRVADVPGVFWRYAWAKGTSSPVTVELDGDELLHIPGSLNDLGRESEPFWVLFRSNADVAAGDEGQ